MKRLIVNADDLGYSQEVNAQIFRLIEREQITSTTLIMNAPAVEAAVRELFRYPHISFGVHLNVTEFRPLAQHPGLAALCKENGEFNGTTRKVGLTQEIREAIFMEWCTQVQLAYDLGVPVSHLDSHHHVHTMPKLFPVLKRVQRHFGIRKVRLTRNITDLDEHLRIRLLLAKTVWNFALRNYYSTQTSDFFGGFSCFHSQQTSNLPWRGTIELMCHPGNQLFEAENKLLDTDWQATLVPQAQMISYNDL
jgi:chitin disaccharide deacetylase